MRIPLYRPTLGDEEIKAARGVIESGVLARGKEIELFETEFALYTGKKFAIAVNSGTSALQLSVKALGWKKGDNVITTPYSFIATSNALLFEEVNPVFVDIDPKTLNIDVNKIIEKIDKNTVGVLPVHIWGFAADMERINEIKTKYSLRVLEDACQALCKPLGMFDVSRVGDVSVYSFFENKPMTSGGEGRMIVTDDKKIAEICRSLRDQGRSLSKNWLDHVMLGYNYRMTEIQAAIGRVQLRQLPKFLEKRTYLANKYSEFLKDCQRIQTPFQSNKGERSWFLYYIVLESAELREKIQNHLGHVGVECKTYFPPIPSFQQFKERGYSIKDCPITEDIYERTLALPLFYSMKESEIVFICDEIKQVLKEFK